MFLIVLSLNQFKAIGGNNCLAPIHTMIYTHILRQDGDGVPNGHVNTIPPCRSGTPAITGCAGFWG